MIETVSELLYFCKGTKPSHMLTASVFVLKMEEQNL